MDASTINNLILLAIAAFGASLSALWLGLTMWTWQDMRARSRDPLAQIAASVVVLVLPIVGILVYLLLRPRETLADAYERSLEEEALLQEIEEKPMCPGCGRPIKHEWQVCPHCHTRLKKPCLHCAALLELSWNLCPICATPQTGYDEGQLEAHSAKVPTGRPRSPYEDYEPPSGLEFVDE